MSKCTKCGSEINDGEIFCKNCGTKIIMQQDQNTNFSQSNNYQNNGVFPSIENGVNFQNSQNGLNFQNAQNSVSMQNNQNEINFQGSQNSMNTQSAQSEMNSKNANFYSNSPSSSMPQKDNSSFEDEILINTYIGKNADKLKDGQFSFCSLFFGLLYVVYRKMWYLATIWVLINIFSSMFLSSLSGIITLAFNVFVAIKFKNLYIKHVKEKVSLIKAKNPGATKEQLIAICSKKGGTSIIAVVAVTGLFVLFLFLLFIFLMTFSLKKLDDNVSIFSGLGATESVGDLKIKIPSDFEERNSNTPNYALYELYSTGNYCTLEVKASNPIYNSAEEYIEKGIYYFSTDEKSEIKKVDINDNIWTYRKVNNNSYYYAIMKNNYLYTLDFFVLSDSGDCGDGYSTIVKSLDFK